jgi:hypothetical protein
VQCACDSADINAIQGYRSRINRNVDKYLKRIVAKTMRVEPDVQLLSTILVHDNDYDEKFR